ncbi:MAG: diiron oxygenase [Myxococcota bacterium]
MRTPLTEVPMRSPSVVAALAGPALRGLVLRRGRRDVTDLRAKNRAHFDWTYTHDRPDMAKLVAAARRGQWDPAVDLDWATPVDPLDPSAPILKESESPLSEHPGWRKLDPRTRATQSRDLLAWTLAQFLHGEQGALFVACQVTESVRWTDGKLYGSTQVADEGRHVEVFDRYIHEKLEKPYVIDDNLYVVLDALMTDGRWDLKFLGMQILIEGLALGAFGTLRHSTDEPLLRELLRLVITDEARHVHFGVIALEEHQKELGERQRREREDWAYEVCVLLRNRFLAHEFYDEHWAHAMSRAEWDRFVLGTRYMERFRTTMFKRIVPNLKRIGLLSERVRPRYEALGLLRWEHEKAAPELRAEDLV